MKIVAPPSSIKSNRWRRRLVRLVASLVVVLGVAEVGARALGVDDFPIYTADPDANYIFVPNQSGSFLGRYDYAINERSMAVAERFPANGTGILLVGDSVVLGGNRIALNERMGALLARSTSCKVWPLTASSWAIANQLDYLLAHPDLLKVDTIAFVVNDGDFGEKSLWQHDLMQPTKRPKFVSAFAIAKYFYKPTEIPRFFSDKPDPSRWLPQLVKLREQFKGRVIIIGYPDLDDVKLGRFDKYDISIVPSLPALAAVGKVEYVSVLGKAAWTAEKYDGDIHPRSDAYPDLVGLMTPSFPKCSPSTASVSNS